MKAASGLEVGRERTLILEPRRARLQAVVRLSRAELGVQIGSGIGPSAFGGDHVPVKSRRGLPHSTTLRAGQRLGASRTLVVLECCCPQLLSLWQ